MSFSTYRYLLMTVDPVHIGTGGMRLGRVDNSIVREPGTRLPKIPGTSLSGAVRSYAAYRYGKRDCAGQGAKKDGKEGHCGGAGCPICYTFGSVAGDRAFSGAISIGDARLLLFPVYSMAGPVWVGTAEILREAGFKLDGTAGNGSSALTTMNWSKPLNLGWLMIEKPGRAAIEPPERIKNKPEWNAVAHRIVIVSDKLFTQIVNSNLEVRTSVSIDPNTGAAEEGALFTYEAIPRGALLWMDVVIDDYQGKFKPITRQYDSSKGDDQGQELGASWNTVADVIGAGLDLAEHLGIGGMGTRGFGRIRDVDKWQAYPAKEAIKSDAVREAAK